MYEDEYQYEDQYEDQYKDQYEYDYEYDYVYDYVHDYECEYQYQYVYMSISDNDICPKHSCFYCVEESITRTVEWYVLRYAAKWLANKT